MTGTLHNLKEHHHGVSLHTASFHVTNCCCSPLLSTRSKAHGCEKNDTQFISVTLLRMVQGNYRNNFCSDHLLRISVNVEEEWGVGEGGRREQKLKGTRRHSFDDGDMEGFEYRNTANKIEQTPP